MKIIRSQEEFDNTFKVDNSGTLEIHNCFVKNVEISCNRLFLYNCILEDNDINIVGVYPHIRVENYSKLNSNYVYLAEYKKLEIIGSAGYYNRVVVKNNNFGDYPVIFSGVGSLLIEESFFKDINVDNFIEKDKIIINNSSVENITFNKMDSKNILINNSNIESVCILRVEDTFSEHTIVRLITLKEKNKFKLVFSNLNFFGMEVNNVDFKDVKFLVSNFIECKIKNCDFSKINIESDIKFKDCFFENNNLGDWKLLRDQLTFNSSWFRLYNKQGFYK